ncbi:MAG: TSUP family transporter [Brachymonas sp.]|nr:TSUP family transporter [Brachymonas sp.]
MLVLTVGSLAVGSIYVPQIKRWIAQLRIRTTALITGALVGATGTGGGVLVVPALMAEGSESTQRIIGSSLIIGLILSAVTALFYGAAGSLNLNMALWMTAGSLLAMPVARMIFKRVSAQALTHLVASLAAASLVLLAFNLLQAR